MRVKVLGASMTGPGLVEIAWNLMTTIGTAATIVMNRVIFLIQR
jgi:hypothetical protein